ncbi:glycerol-3-phosphate dehydrogenase subunit C [Desulfohalotomaculum tongense]|uniref:anaerobic glycerol-3-phosphate dehydrogenase subunit C n=1 Tax=Desulforadius tongensis TaxID=1216062 RepID=UPI00195D8F55|nr:glycerol-3-phosphate dehydrogenase subunit C [Desulforadius tongensis]
MNKTNELALDNCIKCSICVTHCPVAKVTDKFAGPKQNGPDLERFRLEEPLAVHPSIEYCSNCKNCEVACPSGVSISTMNCRAKGEYVAKNGAPLRDRLLANVELMGDFARLMPGLVNWGGKVKLFRELAERIFNISADMTLPQYASKTFYELYRENKPPVSAKKVVYFPGCYVTYNTPEVGLALVKVMAHNGVEVLVEEFNCCGVPLIANGLLADAKNNARNNMRKLEKYIDAGYQIVTSCPSCNLALRREYGELFDMEKAHRLAEQVIDVFEYLQVLAENGELKTDFKHLSLTVGYHQPCHLKAVGCGVPSKGILDLVPGVEVNDLDAGCCGLSGSYGFKKEKYAISQEIGRQLFQAVKKKGLNRVITECGMCQLQIHHGTGAEVYHPIQVLAEAYGLGSDIK